MENVADVAGCAVGYCVGSVPVGLWLGRLSHGVDVREHGSGSTGTTNVLRTVGPGAAVATFALDMGKGAVAVAVARALGAGGAGQVGAGLAAVAGHSWPALSRFRGGKGVATAFGGLIVLAPESVPWALVFGGGALATTRMVSAGSMTGAVAATVKCAVEAARGGKMAPLAFSALATALIFARHGGNIARLRHGREPRLTWPFHRRQGP